MIAAVYPSSPVSNLDLWKTVHGTAMQCCLYVSLGLIFTVFPQNVPGDPLGTRAGWVTNYHLGCTTLASKVLAWEMLVSK